MRLGGNNHAIKHSGLCAAADAHAVIVFFYMVNGRCGTQADVAFQQLCDHLIDAATGAHQAVFHYTAGQVVDQNVRRVGQYVVVVTGAHGRQCRQQYLAAVIVVEAVLLQKTTEALLIRIRTVFMLLQGVEQVEVLGEQWAVQQLGEAQAALAQLQVAVMKKQAVIGIGISGGMVGGFSTHAGIAV